MTESRPVGIADTDVYISRTFDAPVVLLWKFWTSPAHIVQWFGPTDFHVPDDSVQIEPIVGGTWNLSMASDATGERFPIRGTFLELQENELIVIAMDAVSEVGELNSIRLSVQFHDHGDRTRLTLHQGPFSAEERDLTAGGWALSFHKLDIVLTGESA